MFVADTPAAGVLWGEFEVNALTYGLAYKVQFTLEGIAVGAIDFYDADGAHLAGELSSAAPFVVEGVVPDGATHAMLSSCGTGGGSAAYGAG